MKQNIYQRITQQILDNLEKAGSWQKLWDTPQPVSLNGHTYRGINYLLLSTSKYSSPVWATFNQVRKNGGKVNKGEKSTIVVFWKRYVKEVEDSKTGEFKQDVKYFLRYYPVFNTDQCEFDELGKEAVKKLTKASENTQNERFVPAEYIIENMPNPPKINMGAHETPCYAPLLDEIRMPDLKYFYNSNAYYAAFFHELIHSTGHEKRLNRCKIEQLASKKSYSKEELVAELGAAYLLTIAGLKHNNENTAAYIKGWLSVLKDNPTWVVWASSRAQKACEFITNNKVYCEAVSV